MKAEMQKRYRSVIAALEKASKDIKLGEQGIMAVYALKKAEAAAGKLIFDMVMYEEGNDQDLQTLISQPVLLQTIFATLEHQSAIMSRVNQEKSRAGMRERIEVLYFWLDQNISKYPKRLEDCAEDAVEQIDGLDMTAGTVKKHITQYRKQKGLVTNKSVNKSKKKRK
jgi:hypothetical protein